MSISLLWDFRSCSLGIMPGASGEHGPTPAGLRLGRDHCGDQRRSSLYKTPFFDEFLCSGRNPHPGQLGEGGGGDCREAHAISLSQFNRQPGVILAKFCEQQLDL